MVWLCCWMIYKKEVSSSMLLDYVNLSSKTTVDIENYQSYHSCRQNRLGGGTSILLHDSVKPVWIIDTPFNESFESIAIEIKFKNRQFCVSEFYWLPNAKNELFGYSLKCFLNAIDYCKLSFLCCDQNYDLLKSHLHAPTREFLSNLLNNEYVPCISKPMRVTSATVTHR